MLTSYYYHKRDKQFVNIFKKGKKFKGFSLLLRWNTLTNCKVNSMSHSKINLLKYEGWPA